MRILKTRDSGDLPRETPLLKSRGEIETRSLQAQMQASFTSCSMPTVGQGTQVTTQGEMSMGPPAAPRNSLPRLVFCPAGSSEHPRHSPCTHLPSLTVASRPVILDPADPTGNVAGREPQRWQLLAQEVTVWLRYSCCKNLDGTPVSTWNVPVTPPHYLPDLKLMACWDNNF